MRIMALDLGTKRIGVAISDESATIAQARETVLRKGDDAAVRLIKNMAEDEDVSEIIVGLPLNMDGSEGPRAADCRRFAEKIRRAAALPVNFWDERMSTMEADNIMLEADLSRKKRKKNVDALAARLILQGYLDARASGQDNA